MRALITHLRRQAIAYLALFVALSGVAYAATKAPKNSVVSKSIKAKNVKTSDLANSAVTEEKLGVPLEFVPSANVIGLSQDQVVCGPDPAGECDDFLGARFPGGVTLRSRCENDPMDANGGRLTIAFNSADDADGYRVEANALEQFDANDPALDKPLGDDDLAEGYVRLVTQAEGHMSTIDLTWFISTFGSGTAVCDVEGVAITAEPPG